MPAYTWATGETITATKLNTLETEAWRVANQIAEGYSTSASSTTSTSFVDAAASVTFTAKSTSVYVKAFGGSVGAYNLGTNTVIITVGININGSDYAVCHGYFISNEDRHYPFCGGVLVTGLTAGTSYTAKIRLKISNGTYTARLNYGSYSRQTIAVWDISK